MAETPNKKTEGEESKDAEVEASHAQQDAKRA